MSDTESETAIERFDGDADPYDIREALGDSWGEKALVQVVEGNDFEYYAAAGEGATKNIRIAWLDYFDEPVWVNRNRPGYELETSMEGVTWEIRDWDDVPLETDWDVIHA